MIFPPLSAPRVFGLPIGCDFSHTFIEGLAARMAGQTPETWASVTVLVNTRRAQRRLQELLIAGPARILPDIKVISDLGSDLASQEVESSFKRHLVLADLVGAFLEAQPELAPRTAMFGLAESIADLQDEMEGADISLEDLQGIDVQGLSHHWARNLGFLNILDQYQKALPAQVFGGAEAQQKAAVGALIERWAQVPPQGPVIVAGSTGSRRVTATLMAAVAALPQGAVVLPGYDDTLPPALWSQLGEEHPQYGFFALSTRLGFDPADVPVWHEVAPYNAARNAILSLALRPAPVTPHWLSEAPALEPGLPAAMERVALIEAPDARKEAMAIAVRLREAAEQGQRAALVSPDRNLTRRVSAELGRWGLLPDDSAGHPGKLTPPGIFLRMVATALGQPLLPVNLMEILKHPLCGAPRLDHIRRARRFEARMLRKGPAVLDLATLQYHDKNDDGAAVWLAQLQAVLLPVQPADARPLKDWAALHKTTAEHLAGGALWEKEAGREVAQVFDTLALGEGHETHYEAHQYRALFNTVLERIEVRDDPAQAHPDIAIWGTLEARVQSMDLVIVAGLNEGVWPKGAAHDPWLNRAMRQQAGLMLPERQIGLSAHDFQQALGAREVVISRALREGDAPSVAARWVMRLQNLIGGMEGGAAVLQGMKARGDRHLALAASLDRPKAQQAAAKRPCPAPPLATRPRRLSVTRVEALIRDPYAVYAQYVLGLKPLPPLRRTEDARMRGIQLHAALEHFLKHSMDGLPESPGALYDQSVEVALAPVSSAATRARWWFHLQRAKKFFLESEHTRRAQGTPFALEKTGARLIKGPVFDVTLTCTADRVDIGPGGTAMIYDYKSGNKDTLKQIKTFAVQLPLEGAIAIGKGFEGLNATHVGALELIYLGKNSDVVSLDCGTDDLMKIWQRVTGFLNTYQLAEKGYAARLRPDLINYEGDYDHLARYGEWTDDETPVAEGIS